MLDFAYFTPIVHVEQKNKLARLLLDNPNSDVVEWGDGIVRFSIGTHSVWEKTKRTGDKNSERDKETQCTHR